MEGMTQKRFFATVLALTMSATGALAQETKPKQAQDQAEFELLTAVNTEKDGTKKIALLQQWEQKYPNTAFLEERAVVLVQTYQQLGKAPEMFEAVKKLHGVNPKNAMALIYGTQMGSGDPARYADGEMFAKKLIEALPGLTMEDKDKKAQEALARKALGAIAIGQKNYVKAEQLFTEYLKWNPNSGSVSYSLANAMFLQKEKAKQMPALWHLARGAHYTGDDALPDDTKKKLQAFFEKAYTGYHGSKNGMQEVIDSALKDPFPPEGWKILNSYEQDELEMEKLKQTDEMMYNWVQLKRGLTGPQSATYWEGLKDSAIATKFKGKVISSSPPVKTKEVIVGIRDANNPEVKLILEAPVGKVEPGAEIEFEGAVAKEFTAEPFLLTLEIENAKVTGLPKPVGPAGVRPVAKKPGAKKK
jgi:tetratricopeptide (TPR) repeat protein